MIKLISSKDPSMVQYMQINKYSIPHKWTQGWKFYSLNEKAFDKNPTSLHDEYPEEIKNLGDISQHSKSHIWQTYSQHQAK